MLKPSTILSRTFWALLVLSSITLTAQVRTQRFGQPKNLQSYGIFGIAPATPKLNFPAVNVARMQVQDEQDAKNGLPFRFGTNRDVSINVLDAATKSQRGGYRVYEYSIASAGAFSLNLIFDQFRLKKGSKLFLYNSDRTMVIGPVTDAQNISTGEYWTDLVQGSTLNIELQEPIGGSGTSTVHLKSVIHGYKNLFPDKSFGQAGTCHPNMVCYPAFQNEGDGVAMIVLANGSRLCSGSMVNNMRQTFRSFFLSANHCMSSPEEVPNWLVRFNYQSATCTPSAEDPDVYTTVNGSTYLANSVASDFVLIELSQQVPVSVNTTYNGWNRGAATTSNNFGIHHPRGDVKKISFTNADTQLYGWGVPGTDHLISFWGSLGVTDPGSSGSPLFDGNRRIVGQLHGGPSSCSATGANLRDYYGRFYTSWTGGGTNTTRLSNWLDPDNSAGTTTDGVKPVVSGPTNLISTSTFALNTLNSSVVSWSVTNGNGLVSPTSGTGNSANLTPVATGASVTITFTVSDGQSYPIVFSKEFSTVLCPTATAGTSTPSVCVGGTINLTSSGGNAYTWAGPSGTFSSNSQNPAGFTATTTSFGGVYTVSVSTTTGCNATATTSVSVSALPTVTINPSTSQVCAGTKLNLMATASLSSYAWASNGGTFSSTTNQATFSSNTPGEYSFTVTASNGNCANTATASVSVAGLVSAVISNASPNPICAGDILNLSSTGSSTGDGISYQWKSNPAGFSSTAQNPPINAPIVTSTTVYTIGLTVSNTVGCSSQAKYTVTVVALPKPKITLVTTAICLGASINLLGSGGNAYSWQGPSFNSNAQNPIIANATTSMNGVYSLTVMGNNSCTASTSTTVQIQNNPADQGSLSSNSPVMVGLVIDLKTTITAASYTWQAPDAWVSTLKNPSRGNAKLTMAGVYTLTVKSNAGCTGTNTISVQVVPKSTREAAVEAENIERQAIDMEISAYPNPVTNTLTVEVRLAKPAALTLELLNGLGEKNGQWKLTEESTQHKTELDLSALTGGMYLLQAQAGKQKVVKRVVKIQY